MDLVTWIRTHSQSELLDRLRVVGEATGRTTMTPGRMSQIVAALERGETHVVPAERCLDIFLATNGEVALESLRHDLFGPIDPSLFYAALRLQGPQSPPRIAVPGAAPSASARGRRGKGRPGPRAGVRPPERHRHSDDASATGTNP